MMRHKTEIMSGKCMAFLEQYPEADNQFKPWNNSIHLLNA